MSLGNTTKLRDLQRTILVIADYFDRFCREHGLAYYLMGGTALGAMRHQGFIPWDDDFDVFMDHANYQAFLCRAEKYLDRAQFYLQREETDEWPLFFSKLRLNDTLFVERDNQGRDMHQGIYIDIMCLNNAFASPRLRYLQYLAARILSAHALAKRGYQTNSLIKKGALAGARLVSLPGVKAFLSCLVRSQNRRPSKYVGHFFGRAPFHATSFERAYLAPARRVPFEHLELSVPRQVENYLTVRFGPRHMELPSQAEMEKYPSHAIDVDFGPWQPPPAHPETTRGCAKSCGARPAA